MEIPTGMAIAPPFFGDIGLSPGMTTEILYSFVIIFCSLMIYFGTKELYELSGHKGIKYFRYSFNYLLKKD